MSVPRQRVRFREREAARLTRAIRQAGGGKMVLNPDDGTYTVLIGPGPSDDNDDIARNPWDNHATDPKRPA